MIKIHMLMYLVLIYFMTKTEENKEITFLSIFTYRLLHYVVTLATKVNSLKHLPHGKVKMQIIFVK